MTGIGGMLIVVLWLLFNTAPSFILLCDFVLLKCSFIEQPHVVNCFPSGRVGVEATWFSNVLPFDSPADNKNTSTGFTMVLMHLC